MLRTVQLRYGSDNLGYLICGKSEAAAVDGGAVKEILAFLRSSGLRLSLVLNTHSHSDHTCGNRSLIESTGARHLGCSHLARRGGFELEDARVEVIPTPGHTSDSICFHLEGSLLTGDTLFCGRVGRCFTGDVEGFYRSIMRINSFPANTLILGGHDYVEEYMEFAAMVEPGNSAIAEYLDAYDPENVSASLGVERTVDPFLRLNASAVVKCLLERHLPLDTGLQRFRSLLSLM